MPPYGTRNIIHSVPPGACARMGAATRMFRTFRVGGGGSRGIASKCISELARLVPPPSSFPKAELLRTDVEPCQEAGELGHGQGPTLTPITPLPFIAFVEVSDNLVRRQTLFVAIRRGRERPATKDEASMTTSRSVLSVLMLLTCWCPVVLRAQQSAMGPRGAIPVTGVSRGPNGTLRCNYNDGTRTWLVAGQNGCADSLRWVGFTVKAPQSVDSTQPNFVARRWEGDRVWREWGVVQVVGVGFPRQDLLPPEWQGRMCSYDDGAMTWFVLIQETGCPGALAWVNDWVIQAMRPGDNR